MIKSLTLALKDITLLLRDRAALFWVLVFPLLIAVVFGSVFGGSNGMSKIDVALVDQDQTKQSAQLISALKDSKSLNVVRPEASPGENSLQAAQESVRKGNLAAYILVPKGYGEEVMKFSYADGPAIHLGLDPSRQAEAGMLSGITAQAAFELMGTIMGGLSDPQELKTNVASIESSPMDATEKRALIRLMSDAGQLQHVASPGSGGAPSKFEFQGPNIASDSMADSSAKPRSAFEITFPQAIIWGLLGVISSFAISLVKEREQGTLVRLRTSMSMGQILAGKALACLLTCMGVMAALVLVGHLVFQVRLESPLLFLAAILSGSICIVGIVMLLSVIGRTEQAVSGSSWGIMITMSMFGGGMIPVFMMPTWMQTASNFSPLKWTVLSIEGAIWRGFSWREMMTPCLILIAIGAATFFVGVRVLTRRA